MAYTDFLNKYILGPKTQIRTEKNDLKSVADTEAELQKQINKKQVNEGEILNTPGTVDPGFLKSDGTVKDAGQDVNKNSYGDSENIEVNKNKGKRFGGAKFKNTGFERNLQTNVLEQFRTHSQIWSMFILTPDECAKPDETYMLDQSEPLINIIKGAGGSQNVDGATKGRRVTTELEDSHGRVEYYIDNVIIDSVLGQGGPTRMPPVHQFRFEVTEPYSMGQFLEALQIGAVTAGFKSYIDATVCLVCEFIGHTDDNKTVRVAKRYFPMQMSAAVMTVDAGGTKYECEGIAKSGSCYVDSVQMLQTDVTIIGGTVEEALQSGSQSLTRVMNTTLLEREATETQQFADEYIIMFPKTEDMASEKIQSDGEVAESGKATYDPKEVFESRYGEGKGKQLINYEDWIQHVTGFSVKRSKASDKLRANAVKQDKINDIGKAKLLSDKLGPGGIRPGSYYASYDKEKNVFEQGTVNIPNDKRAFKFTKETKLNNIIEEMVVASDYGKDLLTRPTDKRGYREWFTIQAMIFNLPVKQVADIKARMPRIYVFKVIPFKVHGSLWQGPSDISEGTLELKSSVRKEYNYIYTGKNKDILNFDIRYDYRFLTRVPMDKGETKAVQEKGTEASYEDAAGLTVKSTEGDADAPKVPLKPVGAMDIEPITTGMRGTTADAKDAIAREFHAALINSQADLVNCKLEIMGDPWYLSDSGLGNYQADSGTVYFDDKTGQMDYIRQQVFILLNFRTPFDYDKVAEGGLLTSKGAMTVKQFSGLYRVTKLVSTFNQGQFSQELEIIRVMNQEGIDTEKKGDGSKAAVELKEKEKDNGNSSTTSSYTTGYQDASGGYRT